MNKFNHLLTSKERFDFINQQINSISDDGGYQTDLDLQQSYKFEKFLYTLDLKDLFKNNIRNESIEMIFDSFYEKFMSGIFTKLEEPNESIYTITEAKFLGNANTLTRALSTELGRVWEDIASLSDSVISPEDAFGGFKAKGVDLIILEDGYLRFTQLKTAKGTLTGSQKPRSEKELSVFRYSQFAVAHNLGAWTFNSNKIDRIAGEEFWNSIGMDYQEIVHHLTKLISRIEPEMLDYFRSRLS
tara:strand:- start:79 stop:810 length:732 start_codon:yes stop_codon:yes gene_type:complete